MTLPFSRNFQNGRQSEQFLNDELLRIFEMLRYLSHYKTENKGQWPPPPKLRGALNVQPADETINFWDSAHNQWVPFFRSKFQIVDQIMSEEEPKTPVVGQLWINNGILCYFNGYGWEPIKSIQVDDAQWASAAFADFQIISPMNPAKDHVVDIGGHQYVVTKTEAMEETVDDYWKYFYDNQMNYQVNQTAVTSSDKWDPNILSDGSRSYVWNSPELPVPPVTEISRPIQSQFIVPSVRTDRIFLGHKYDQSYEPVSSICFQYPTTKALSGTISGIHLNPGKLVKMTKRFFKIDKLNPTIGVSAYNTEFYGYRESQRGGELLLPSANQDAGDYMPSEGCIVLNYNATQDYDYVMSITYDFTWIRSDGSVSKKSPDDATSSFYLANLRSPLNIHVNGLKLEEASYDVNFGTDTVTIKDNAANVQVEAWSPYKKQYGYIRETDLRGWGIIKLHKPVKAPLVFVGGLLMHPLYSGLEIEDNIIYVPNSGGKNQMRGMQWCVIDLTTADDKDQVNVSGKTTQGASSEQAAIRNFIVASGITNPTAANNAVIKYDKTKIKSTDSVVVFIDGLMVAHKDVIRDADNGYITVPNGVPKDKEYVVLKDRDGAIYDSSMAPALGLGFISDTLIYCGGKLLAEPSCVNSLMSPEMIDKEKVAHGEIKYFITNDETGQGDWRIYDQYNEEWPRLPADDANLVAVITNSYENQLTSVRFNFTYDRIRDEVTIYAFKFANEISGLVEIGSATLFDVDEEDNMPIYFINGKYGYDNGTLNVFRNGIKLLHNIDYFESASGESFKLKEMPDENDVIQYLIEPVERGYDNGHIQVILTKDNALQPNVYKISDNSDVSLYPGRLSVYINGVRIPKDDWVLLSSKSILLKYTDYKASGSADNYPEELMADEDHKPFVINHTYPDLILVEIRYDYDRKEKTIHLTEDEFYGVDVVKYELDKVMLDASDEIIFYLNGQFAALSRNKNTDYRLDRYRGCISFSNEDFLETINRDPLDLLFKADPYAYNGWKKMTGKLSYQPKKQNVLTILWR